MPCDPIDLPGGGVAIVCTRGRRKRKPACKFCGVADAGFLCDAPVAKRRTCDAPICGGCRVNVGPNVDVCPEHAKGTEVPR